MVDMSPNQTNSNNETSQTAKVLKNSWWNMVDLLRVLRGGE